MSDLVGNPEDRFSRVEALMVIPGSPDWGVRLSMVGVLSTPG